MENRTAFQTLECCGVKELFGLDATLSYVSSDKKEAAIAEIVKRFGLHLKKGEYTGAFVLFSSIVGYHNTNLAPYGHGDMLKKFIETYKLGTVQESVEKVNPNSMNTIKVYLWAIDRNAIVNF